MATVTDYTALLAINDEPDARWNGITKLGKPTIVTYSFADGFYVPTVSQSLFDVTSTSAFSDAQRANFRKVIEVYEAVTGVLFVEVSEGGMIDVSNADGSDYGGWANYAESSQNYTGKGVLVVDSDNGDYNNGSYGYLTMLHEVGHALGLQHPHDGSVLLAGAYDIQSNTVMTYNNTEPFAVGLGVFDIQALQHLYGIKVDTSDWAVSYDEANRVLKVVASGADDFILGVAGDNDLRGGGGDDTLLGREDSNTLSGGEGHDVLKGMNGKDTLFGRSGDDTLVGGIKGYASFNDSDVLFGGSGNDTLYGYYYLDSLDGGSGDDKLFGGKNSDKLLGAAGDDFLNGGSGDDSIFGGIGNDKLVGKTGNDILFGGTGNDQLTGSDGSNAFYGGRGNDVLRGGKGKDIYHIRANSEDDKITNFSVEHDRIDFSGKALAFSDLRITSQNFGKNTLVEFTGTDASVLLIGVSKETLRLPNFTFNGVVSYDEIIHGNDDGNTLNGGRGNDTLFGGKGSDSLYGEDGFDILYGGAGADNLFGGDGSNTLYGGAGDDRLNSGSGSEHFVGGAGADLFFIGEIYGKDRILDFKVGVDRIDLTDNGTVFADLQFTSANGGEDTRVSDGVSGLSLYLVGVKKADLSEDDFLLYSPPVGIEIIGDEHANVLYGGALGDTLYGLEKGDTLFGGVAGNDTLFGGKGIDTLYGESGSDILFGGAGADNLFGGDGSNTLYGGAGVDRLYSGSGSEHLVGGAGADLFFIGEMYGNDRILDFQVGIDQIDLIDNGTVFANLQLTSANGGADTRISDGASGLSLYLVGVKKADLSEDDFLLYSPPTDLEVIGDELANTLYGGALNDTLYGLGGDDRLYGGTDGNDTIFGGGGNDFLETSTQNNFFFSNLHGEAGDDTLLMGSFSGNLYGGEGNDILKVVGSNTETYHFYGGDGSDTIYGGTGFASSYFGGRGDDFFDVSRTSFDDTFFFDDKSGNDRIVGFRVNDSLIDFSSKAPAFSGLRIISRNEGKDTLVEFAGTGASVLLKGVTVETLQSTNFVVNGVVPYDDTIIGGAGSNVLLGAAGNDTLFGNSGSDTLFGGEGSDSLSGGTGNDHLYGGTGDDLMSGGAGTDVFVVGPLSGENTITDCEIGFDTIHLSGFTVEFSDLVFIAQNNGEDTRITSAVGGINIYLEQVDASNLSQSDFRIEAGIEVVGDSENNTLVGSVLGDQLSGLAGKDTLRGLAGNDTLFGGKGSDVLYGGDGNDRLEGGRDTNFAVKSDQLYGGNGNDTLISQSLFGALYGGAGDDVFRFEGKVGESVAFYGGSGNDTLDATGVFNGQYDGGEGDDHITGSLTSQFYFQDNSGHDTIENFNNGYIDLSEATYGYADFLITEKNGGRDTLIEVSGYDVSIYLVGVTELPDYIFA